jgi:DNA-binding transcriptional LysR family regulator
LFEEKVMPVAHPGLGLRTLNAETLTELILLEFDDLGRPWLRWSDRLLACGLGGVRPKGVLYFNQYDQVIQAAAAGQGVALGRSALVAPMLADGRLVALDWEDRSDAGGYAYWLVQADPVPREDVRAVADWIFAQRE